MKRRFAQKAPGRPANPSAKRLAADFQVAEAVQRALAVTGGNVSKAAELLGVTRPTLYDLIQRTAANGVK